MLVDFCGQGTDKANTASGWAMTSLHTAARNGDVSGLQKLLASNADLADRDSLNRTALHLAAWAGQTVRFSSPCTRPNMHDRPGSMQEVVAVLLAHNVQISAAANDGMTALHFCAMKGHAEAAKLLIGAGGCMHIRTCGTVAQQPQCCAGLHVDCRTKKGMTPLAMSVQAGETGSGPRGVLFMFEQVVGLACALQHLLTVPSVDGAGHVELTSVLLKKKVRWLHTCASILCC